MQMGCYRCNAGMSKTPMTVTDHEYKRIGINEGPVTGHSKTMGPVKGHNKTMGPVKGHKAMGPLMGHSGTMGP